MADKMIGLVATPKTLERCVLHSVALHFITQALGIITIAHWIRPEQEVLRMWTVALTRLPGSRFSKNKRAYVVDEKRWLAFCDVFERRKGDTVENVFFPPQTSYERLLKIFLMTVCLHRKIDDNVQVIERLDGNLLGLEAAPSEQRVRYNVDGSKELNSCNVL
jgi:hypothetical protein